MLFVLSINRSAPATRDAGSTRHTGLQGASLIDDKRASSRPFEGGREASPFMFLTQGDSSE